MSAVLVDTGVNVDNDNLLASLMGKTAETEPMTVAHAPLPPPVELMAEMPLTPHQAHTVAESRRAIRRILNRQDERLLVIVGPCSIHDTEAALDYAHRLAALQRENQGRLLFVMRAYFEKPRTTVGWRGLINDPHMDGSFEMGEGLRRARRLLRQITQLGLPVATEVLDMFVPNYLTDLLSFAAIGARTTESQPHRALASGLPIAVGFKNGTDGGVQIALDALQSARESHSYLGLDSEGRCTITRTAGNQQSLVILRGGKVTGPNYHPEHITGVEEKMGKIGLVPNVMVDCSHANSGYEHSKQSVVCQSVSEQRRNGNRSLVGIMLESNLYEGKQSLQTGASQNLRYGVSVTDACMGWEETASVLRDLHSNIDV